MNQKVKEKQIRYLLFLFYLFICCFSIRMTEIQISAMQLDTNEENNRESNQTKLEDTFDITAPSYILMEASSGKIICEKEADMQKSPASITKIMTLLLIFEEIDKGKLRLEDKVVTSAYAKSMGGSQVFLEEGEEQTVDTLLKCITVASGNDASVAMAEKIAGSEEAFVKCMNEKAKSLGLVHTHFTDCCGLTDSKEHYTCAKDIAIMAKELITKYPKIYDYTKIWMDTIIHTTAKGSKEFTLSSTNKLLKQYPYTTGLKTGSTSLAKFCFCATARNNNIDLIAVVMACPSPKDRFLDAKHLLEYGYEKVKLYEDKKEYKRIIPVKKGIEEQVMIKTNEPFRYFDLTGSDLSKITQKMECKEKIEAPVKKGEKVGRVVYYLNQQEIGENPIVCTVDLQQAFFQDVLKKIMRWFLMG